MELKTSFTQVESKIGAISDENLHISAYFVRVYSINKVYNALPIRFRLRAKHSHNFGRNHFRFNLHRYSDVGSVKILWGQAKAIILKSILTELGASLCSVG